MALIKLQPLRVQTNIIRRGVLPKRNITVSRPSKRRQIVTQASLSAMDAVTLLGHSVVYFTMFYCGLNWYFYRSIRKEQEKKDK